MTIKHHPANYLFYFIILFLFSVITRPADGSAFDKPINFEENRMKEGLMAEAGKENRSNGQTGSRSLISAEIVFASTQGEIYLNPKYIGRIVSITPLGPGISSSGQPKIELNQTKDLWPVLIVPGSMSNLERLSVTGEEGSISISTSSAQKALNLDSNDLKTIATPKVAFGQLSSTILFKEIGIRDPSKFEIGVFDFENNRFINGEIIALTNNQMAVKFENLPPTVISTEGKLRYSLKDQDGSFINSDMNAWGCELVIPDADVGTSVPIKARVFGLPDDSKVKFTFHPLEGQKYSSPVSTLSVAEINSGEPVATISTSITGSQLISVAVEESLQ